MKKKRKCKGRGDPILRKLLRIAAAGALKLTTIEKTLETMNNKNMKEGTNSPKTRSESAFNFYNMGVQEKPQKPHLNLNCSTTTATTARNSFSSVVTPASRVPKGQRTFEKSLDIQDRAMLFNDEIDASTVRRPTIQNDADDILWAVDTHGDSPTTIFLPDTTFRWVHDCFVVLFTSLDLTIAGYIPALDQWNMFPTAVVISILSLSSALHAFTVYLNFRTAYLSGWELVGDDSDEIPIIQRAYLHGWFKVDCLTLLPLDLLLLPLSVKIHRILCVMRVIRVSKIHRLFRVSDPLRDRPPWAFMVFFLFAWMMAVHFLSCAWIFLRNEGDSDKTTFGIYVKALYFIITTMTTVGYGDVIPQGTEEMVFVSFVMVAGAGSYGTALGALSRMLTSTDALTIEASEKRKCLSAFMNKYHIPHSLQREAHALYPAVIERAVYDPEKVTLGLPPWFTCRVVSVLKLHLLKKISFLSNLSPDVLLAVSRRLDVRTVDAGIKVVEYDEEDDPGVPEMKWIAKLREGQVFGELALLEKCRRTAGVRTATACELYVLAQEAFTELTVEYPALKDALEEERDRRLKTMNIALKSLPNVDADNGSMPSPTTPCLNINVLDLPGDTLQSTAVLRRVKSSFSNIRTDENHRLSGIGFPSYSPDARDNNLNV